MQAISLNQLRHYINFNNLVATLVAIYSHGMFLGIETLTCIFGGNPNPLVFFGVKIKVRSEPM